MVLLFGLISIFCFVYYIYIALYAGYGSSFVVFWLIGAIVSGFMSFGIFFAKKYSIIERIPRLAKIVFLSVLVIGFALFIIVEGLVISSMTSKAQPNMDYIIVLGAQVRGEFVTKPLRKRLDTAIEYLDENVSTKVIVSGGQGRGEDITEAEAMKRYLVRYGIDESRIIMEDKSTNTKENLMFSYELIEDKSATIAIVTNNFHVFRAVSIAKKIGIENVSGHAASADNRLLLNYMVRESMAIVKEKMLGHI